MFIDPRSSRIRENFQVLNKNLAEIRKIDPKMELLSSITHRHRFQNGKETIRQVMRQSSERIGTSDWQHRSNAEILGEILKIGRKQ